MSWRITDLTSCEYGELATNLIRDSCRGSNDVKGPDTFTVQAGIFCETLTDQHRDTTFGEFPNGPGILVQIAASETLVGAVEKGVMTLLQHHICDLIPLFLRRVNTGRIMGAGVKEKNRTVWSSGERGEELSASEADCFGIIVLVGKRFDRDISEDGEVVHYGNHTSGAFYTS